MTKKKAEKPNSIQNSCRARLRIETVIHRPDPDACTNGFSGPSNAIAPGSRVATVNNYKRPFGGPAECPWATNNCGPNDEPFSFHPGGVNCVMGDGSVRFVAETTDTLVLKFMSGAQDGQTVQLD